MSIDPPATVESNAAHEDLESKANQKNRGEDDYRKLVGCRGLMPGAGLAPPPASSSLHIAGLPANWDAGSSYRERAGDALSFGCILANLEPTVYKICLMLGC